MSVRASSPRPNKWTWIVAILIGVASALGLFKDDASEASPGGTATATVTPTAGAEATAAGSVDALFAARQSETMVTFTGSVERVLADDNDGSRHQRFLVGLDSGLTVLIAHNIDLAPRVPLTEDETVKIRGQYEWNEKGGVVHWTHHDPGGYHDEGWIEHEGKRYE